MNGEERREKLVELLKNTESPLSGTRLSRLLHVSRQVIVNDIALLRAANVDILSTNKGYLLSALRIRVRLASRNLLKFR